MFVFKNAELVGHRSSAGNPRVSPVHGCSYTLREKVTTLASAFGCAEGRGVSLFAVVLIVMGSQVSLSDLELAM